MISNNRYFLRSYKEDHEAFVSNLKGTSAGDVLTCLAHIPLAIILLKLVQKSSLPLLLRDLVYLVLPVLLSVTILADYSYVTLLILLIGEIIALQRIVQTSIKLGRDHQNDNISNDTNIYDSSEQSLSKSKTSFISLFKGGTVLATCISILAVDFRIFPRRFAKTETFGISLMDVGVAFYFISSALTSRYARGLSNKRSGDGNRSNSNNNNNNDNKQGITASPSPTKMSQSPSSSSSSSVLPSSPSSLFQRIRSIIVISNPNKTSTSNNHPSASSFSYVLNRSIILCLGVGRVIILKLFDYPEHGSEYGIHWNFFVTLFCVWCLADFIHFLFPRKYTPWIATSLLLFYQLLLMENSMISSGLFHTELTNYIFSAPRDSHSFFSANREGVCSLGGFLPLYLLAEHASYQMFFKPKKGDNSNYNVRSSNSNINDNSNSGNNVSNNNNNPSNTSGYQLQQPTAAAVTQSFDRTIGSREKGNYCYSTLAALTPTTADSVTESDAVTDAEDTSSGSSSNNNNASTDYRDFLYNSYNDDTNNDSNSNTTNTITNESVDDIGNTQQQQSHRLSSTSNDKLNNNNDNNNTASMDYLDLAVGSSNKNNINHTSPLSSSSSRRISSSGINSSRDNNNNNITTTTTTTTTTTNNANNKNIINLYGIIPWRILVPPIYRAIIRQLSVLAFSLWSLWVLSSILLQPTSRRLTNIPFVLFSFALAMTCLLLTLLADIITGSSQTVKVVTLEYLNRFQLPVFLFANVLTGVINMLIPTMYISPVLAFFILVLYTSAVVSFAWFLGSQKIFHRK